MKTIGLASNSVHCFEVASLRGETNSVNKPWLIESAERKPQEGFSQVPRLLLSLAAIGNPIVPDRLMIPSGKSTRTGDRDEVHFRAE